VPLAIAVSGAALGTRSNFIIVADRIDPSLFNCIVLCRECHRQMHQRATE